MLVGNFVGDHLLLRDFGPYGIFMNALCVAITVAKVLVIWCYGILDLTG
jgi:hypothetical protein